MSGLAFPKPQRKKRRKAVAECKESDLQIAADDYLQYKQIRFFRIPDNFWKWFHVNATQPILKWFRWAFGGMADNTCFIPISDKYSLCLHLELKTQDKKGNQVGKLHGRQKVEARELPWQIATNTNKIVEIINKFEKDAESLRLHLTALNIFEPKGG